MPPKPQILADIKSAKKNLFRSVSRRVNLYSSDVITVPVIKACKGAFLFCAAWMLVLGSAAAPTYVETFAAGVIDENERQQLEIQLRELETQIDQYEDQVQSYQKQGSTLKGEISRLNSKIAKLNLQIQAINLTLTQLDRKIGETEVQIAATETSLAEKREALATLVRNIYQADRVNLVEIFLKNPKLSDFFGDLNNIMLLQGELRVTIEKIAGLRDELTDQKEQYALARADAQTLQDYQAAQRKENDSAKKQKSQLLAVTKGQEVKYQALLKQTQATAAQIRNRIFQLLGGGQLSFEQAYEYAKFASNVSGVRPALILAVLDRESALGRNVGKCSYKTAMSPKNQEIYLRIVAELGIAPDTVYVSCPNADGVYGGAMGPAQFIPSTWETYKAQIAKVTGNNSPSPWNNGDAFVATALYLRDAGAANTPSVAKEREAAAKYYAGGRWRGYLWTYGEAVVSRASSFQRDIDTITG